jgi:hypothetical protein
VFDSARSFPHGGKFFRASFFGHGILGEVLQNAFLHGGEDVDFGRGE